MNKSFRLTLESDGNFKKSKVSLNNTEVPCKSLYIVGNAQDGLDVVLALSVSKASAQKPMLATEDYEVKQPLIGFQVQTEDDLEEFEEEDDE